MKLDAEWKLTGEIIGVLGEEETDLYSSNPDHWQYIKAIRRHYRERIISKRLKRVREGRWFVKSLGYLGKNNTVCPCWMCGNPRKYFGEVTRQEKMAEIRETIEQGCLIYVLERVDIETSRIRKEILVRDGNSGA